MRCGYESPVLSWLREYCDPGMDPAELADRLVMTGTEVERIDTVGPPSAEGFVVGKVVEREQHPNADRLQRLHGRHRRRRAARSSAAPPTSPPARPSPSPCPGRRMPGGEKLRKAKLRGVPSEGMILSAAELEIGEDARRDHGPRRRARRRARRWPRCCRWASRCWRSR